jgi:hypothetical protein
MFAATVVAVLFCYEVGFRAGRWRSRRSEREQREYVDVRLEGVRSGNIEQAISRSQELHSRLQQVLVDLRRAMRKP